MKQPAAAGLSIGIDLGLTNSRCAYSADGGAASVIINAGIVARALVPAVSKLISTRVRGCDRASYASAGMGAGAALSRPKTCRKCGPRV